VDVPTDVQMPAVTMNMADYTRMVTNHPVMTTADDATMTMTAAVAAAMRTSISSSRDERRQADNGRGDESEECSTFEHCERPFWLEMNHPCQ
jgi:hypothetical protein